MRTPSEGDPHERRHQPRAGGRVGRGDAPQPDRRLETNVEFYTAALLHGVGVPRDLFTATFGVSRVGGWTAHCREQLADNRLIRPRARYVGATDRRRTPAGDR